MQELLNAKAELIEARAQIAKQSQEQIELIREKIRLREEKIELIRETIRLRQEQNELLEALSRVVDIAAKKNIPEIIAVLQEFS